MIRWFFTLLLCVAGASAVAAELMVEPQLTHELELELRGELDVYKDPSLFLPQVAEVYRDPDLHWDVLKHEKPHLTTVSGPTCLRKLGPPTRFRDFGLVTRLYEAADPRLRLAGKGPDKGRSPLIVPVQLCGNTRYKDTLGFVLASDLEQALHPPGEAVGMPPSTKGNPIPEWSAPARTLADSHSVQR